MTRKFTTYLLICSAWFSMVSCDDDEVSAPPKTTFTQNKTSVLTGDEVTFVVDEVDADAIALLPYGQEEGGRAGVLISKAAFSNGKATIVYKYSQIGSFSPVVVTSNFSDDGESVERSVSDATTIAVSSSGKDITAFTFDNSTKTTISQDANTIVVELPYAEPDGDPINIATLKAKFSASPFTTVKVGGTTQTSETTVNSFASPLMYEVVAANGSSRTYTVTVNQKAVETSATLESFAGKSISTNFKDKQLQGFVDNTNDFVVVLAPYGQSIDVLDSVRVSYNTAGDFGILHYATAVDTLEQDSLLDLRTAVRKEVTVEAQNGTTNTYTIHPAIAPKIKLSFLALNPNVEASSGDDFTVNPKVLKGANGTDVSSLVTTFTPTANAGQTIGVITMAPVDDDDTNDTPVVFVSGDVVDFSTPVKFWVTVVDTNIGETYKVEYTATVTVLE